MGISSTRVTPGTVLAGKYRVEEVLGEGGMGVVVRATHMVLDEPVALKFLLPELTSVPEAAERFLREAKAAMRIRGQHVAQILDAGKLDGGEPFLVMEYLHGQDLEAMLESGGPLPVSDAVDAVLQACRALHDAHASGVVHRDIKPANLFATSTPSGQRLIKVLDFGISKLAGEEISSLTKTDTMMGSALYMSPEQLVSSRDVDHRTDIYALGVTLYQLLTNDFPFMGDTMPQLVAQVLNGHPQPLRQLRPAVPTALAAVVARAMARLPEDRHPTIAALATALAPFASAVARVQLASIVSLGTAPVTAPLGTAPLGATPLGATPLGATPLGATPLGATPAPTPSAPRAIMPSTPGTDFSSTAATAVAPVPTASAPAGSTPGDTIASASSDAHTIPIPPDIGPMLAAAAARPALAVPPTVAPTAAMPMAPFGASQVPAAARGTQLSNPDRSARPPWASTAAPTSRSVEPAQSERPRWPLLLGVAAAVLSVVAAVAFVGFSGSSSPGHGGAAAATHETLAEPSQPRAADEQDAELQVDEVASAAPDISAAPSAGAASSTSAPAKPAGRSPAFRSRSSSTPPPRSGSGVGEEFFDSRK